MSTSTAPDPHRDDPARTAEASPWSRELLVLMLAVLVLGLGFVFSYVAAFHRPTPHRVNIELVAPPGHVQPLVARLNGLAGTPLHAQAAPNLAAARRDVRGDRTAAALVINPRGRRDRLLVAGGGGAALSSAVGEVLTRVEAAQHRRLATTDLVPLQSGDYRGLTGFYLVVGCLIAGYLLASILGITLGPQARGLGDARRRLTVIVPYSILAGAGAALIVGPLLGALSGHFLAIAGVGTLLVMAGAYVTVALQSALGVAGIGLAILLYVVLGNPSAGGAYQNALLPGFWRAIGNALPNGAGVDAIRRFVYFGGQGATGHLVVIGLYCVVAIVATLLITLRRSRGLSSADPAAPRS